MPISLLPRRLAQAGSTVFGVALAAFLSSTGPARAGGPVVVELFTSQGCSSCPPADALLGELAQRDDVIALGLHVDYWDYLGWRDVFGLAANSRRQKAYAEALGQRMVYTPQIVIDGTVAVIGSRRDTVIDEIALAAALPDEATVSIVEDSGWIAIEVGSVENLVGIDREARVKLFVLERPTQVEIGRGENGGRRLTYHNAVRAWWALGPWRGEPARWRVPTPQDASSVAIVVQRAGMGRVLGAARLDLPARAPRVSAVARERPAP